MASKNSNSQDVINHVKRRKKELISVFGSKCCICGFDKYQEALEFHHVNPEEKEFGITDSRAVTKSLEKQLAEMRKCVLVCANCHRGIHAGYLQLPDNYKESFSEEVAQELLDINYRKRHKQIAYCQRCHKEVSRAGIKYCPECAQFLSRRAERPDREVLKELIRTIPFTTIGKNYGVSDNAIRNWCDFYKLPKKKTEINKISDEDWKNI